MATIRRGAGAVLLSLCSALAFTVRAESVEIQAVAASDAGKKPVIPPSLKSYETLLKQEPFGTFVDSGHDTVTANAGGSGSANVGGYTLEVSVLSKAADGKVSVELSIKQGGKVVGPPWKTELKSGHPTRMKAGEQKAPVIFYFTYKE